MIFQNTNCLPNEVGYIKRAWSRRGRLLPFRSHNISIRFKDLCWIWTEKFIMSSEHTGVPGISRNIVNPQAREVPYQHPAFGTRYGVQMNHGPPPLHMQTCLPAGQQVPGYAELQDPSRGNTGNPSHSGFRDRVWFLKKVKKVRFRF